MTEEEVFLKLGNFIYSENDMIGKGSFGKVYKGKSLTDGRLVAIKTVSLGTDRQRQDLIQRMIKTEVETLKKVRSEYIIEYLDHISTTTTVYIITEYCNQKDLRSYINRNRYLNESKALEFFRQVLKGYQVLYKYKILHRDIKPGNVLIHDGVAKLADFGFAKTLDFELDNYTSFMRSVVGTPLYMAPQMLAKEKYTTKSDIWSLGIMYYEMLFGKMPWQGRDPQAYLRNMKTMPLIFPRNINCISETSEEFMIKCLRLNEIQRMGWVELFEHKINSFIPVETSFVYDVGESTDIVSGHIERTSRSFAKESNRPCEMIKTYQGKILRASRDILDFDSEIGRDRSSEFKSFRYTSNMALTNSTGFKGYLYAPLSRTFMMSFYENDNNMSDLQSRKYPESRQSSNSPSYKKKVSLVPRESDEFKSDLKVEGNMGCVKNKICLLELIYEGIQMEETEGIDRLKTSAMLTLARLITILFKNLTNQLSKKSVSLIFGDEIPKLDNVKAYNNFCKMNQEKFENIWKLCSRKVFDLKFANEQQKDVILEDFAKLSNENNEKILIGKLRIHLSKLLTELEDESKASNAKKGPKYLTNILKIAADGFFEDPFNASNVEELLNKALKLKEIFRR